MTPLSALSPGRRNGHRCRDLRRAATAAALVVVTASCGSGGTCEDPAPGTSRCSDLQFRGHLYDEWREIDETAAGLQELGDGTYPACNAAHTCTGSDVGGSGATDVWLLDGVDPDRAVTGLRQDSQIHVIFVRVGVDPDSLPSRRP